MMQISGKTRICGVIGDPIEHSLSPTIQNSAFNHLDLDFVFLAFNVKAEELETAIQCLRALGICGLNVTMPHKTNVVNYLDGLDPTPRPAGRVVHDPDDVRPSAVSHAHARRRVYLPFGEDHHREFRREPQFLRPCGARVP